MSLKPLFLLLVLLTAVAARAQVLPPETIDSLDVGVLNAKTIVVGRVANVDPEGSGETSRRKIAVAVSETLKGEPSERLTRETYASLETLQAWRARSARLLFQVDSSGAVPWRPGPIELDAPNLLVFRKDFAAIRDPAALLHAVRGIVRAHPGAVGVDSLVLPPVGARGAAWLEILGRTYVDGLRIPVEKGLEAQALRWLRSENPNERRAAARVLRSFRSPANEARVRSLLDDPGTTVSRAAELDDLGRESRFYPVRQEAYQTLVAWGVVVALPNLNDWVSRLDTVESLRIDSLYGTEDLAILDRAQRLKSLSLTLFEPLSDAAFAAIVRSRGLTRLSLVRGGIDDARLKALAALPELRSLDLDGNPVTDEGLKTLATFPSLRELRVERTETTDAGLAALRLARPELAVAPFWATSHIHAAIDAHDLAAVRRIVERNPRALEERTPGWHGTPLVGAAAAGDVAIVRYLLERGAKVDAVDEGSGASALEFAIGRHPTRGLDLALLLVAYGADVNHRSLSGSGALETALDFSNLGLVRFLLAVGANPIPESTFAPRYQKPSPEAMGLMSAIAALRAQPVSLVPQTEARCDRPLYALAAPRLEGWTTVATGPSGPLAWNRTPSGRAFLGPFGAQSATLDLTNLPPHRNVHVELELWLLGSWDGNGASGGGPDLVDVSVPGVGTLLHSTFFNPSAEDWRKVPAQSFPDPYPFGFHPGFTGASEIRSLGFPEPLGGAPFLYDSVYRLRWTFAHAEPRLSLVLSGQIAVAPGVVVLGDDERWAVGNLVIRTD